jgi:hypothetical protein
MCNTRVFVKLRSFIMRSLILFRERKAKKPKPVTEFDFIKMPDQKERKLDLAVKVYLARYLLLGSLS